MDKHIVDEDEGWADNVLKTLLRTKTGIDTIERKKLFSLLKWEGLRDIVGK